MKRSEINQIIRNADAYLKKMNFYLPEWAYWDWETWKEKDRSSLHEILTKEMGWDITDFALDDFYHRGMLLFTIRNGSTPETGYDKPYCEKIMILEDGQRCLLHFHWDKVEDIINRGGGILKLQFYNATVDEQLDQKNPVILYVDGIRTEIEPGGILSLVPGQSVTLPQRNYHSFWGDGKVLVGEVSKVNDDHTDNRFFDPIPRFPKVIEDEPIFRPMIGDYKNL